MWREIDYNMSPIEYFLGSCLVVEDVHNLRIEIPKAIRLRKAVWRHISCARTPPCEIYTTRVTPDDPPWNCKNDFRVRIRIVGKPLHVSEDFRGGERRYFLGTTQRKVLSPLVAYSARSPPISQYGQLLLVGCCLDEVRKCVQLPFAVSLRRRYPAHSFSLGIHFRGIPRHHRKLSQPAFSQKLGKPSKSVKNLFPHLEAVS